MAVIIGDSGAWRDIVENLRRRGLEVRRPSDIGPLLTQLRDTFQPSVDQKKMEIAQRVAYSESQIADLRAEKGFWRSVLNWFRIQNCKKCIVQLLLKEQQYIDTLLGNIQKLDTLLKSPELAGAQAELDVIAQFRHLPDSYTIFNDVQLYATRHIRFNGVPLRSARIDHVVLSFAGIFVIETKLWSRSFVESGNYHDPFDQIQRGAYLCYDLLREEFGKVRVRSILVCAGHLPVPPENTHVTVVSLPELDKHIARFKWAEFTSDMVQHLSLFFERHTA